MTWNSHVRFLLEGAAAQRFLTRPSPILRDWSCPKYSRQRRHVQRRFAAKNAPAGQRQIRTISVRRIRAGNWDDYLPAPASASGYGKRRLGEVQVSAARCADLFWTDRG